MAPTEQSAFEVALHQIAGSVDAFLQQTIPQDGRVQQAMRYAVLCGGKRLRPFLASQSGALFGQPQLQTLRIGSALECVHCYSLVHDDLPAMDNDDLRRGMPTTHRQFDEATAILAGDGLLSLAFQIISDPETHPDGNIRALLVSNLAQASGEAGMVGGQMLDIEAETRPSSSLNEITQIQAKKTGALFRFACESGAIATGHDPAALCSYAECFGLAFQIMDDVLDVESSAEALGKATQKDKARGKANIVDYLGIEGAKREVSRLSDAAISALASYDHRADLLRAAASFAATRRK